MAAADKAYAAAERLIAEAKRTGAEGLSFDKVETRALTRLPESIVGLDNLTKLGLDNTEISDLALLSGIRALQVLSLTNTPVNDITALNSHYGLQILTLDGTQITELTLLGNQDMLRELSLNNTRVSDLSQIVGMRRLERLFLNHTPVSDLGPLEGLTRLQRLDLAFTLVSDLTPIVGLVNLGWLSLTNTQVSDLAPLAALTGLRALHLDNTQVSDLAPLTGLKGLGELWLTKTQARDLAPLTGMAEMRTLLLDNTQVSHLVPLNEMTKLVSLDLDNTQVLDLRPLLGLWNLAAEPEMQGLTFKGIPATRDARVAEIAAIENPRNRAAALFALLEPGWEPPWEVEAPVPSRLPAPLEIEVTDSLISVAGADGLPQRDANARAEMGWEALREYQQEFAAAFSVGNYAPLPSYLSAFDGAMGDQYDPARVVRIGVQAQRFVALSQDAAFIGNLPDGAAGDLKMFAAEMLVWLNRFPDWVAYRDDAEAADPNSVREVKAAFDAVQMILEETPEVTSEVGREYAAQVAEGTGESATEVEATALVASSREIPRAIAEYEALRRKSNRDLASAGGEFLNGLVRGPIGVPFHLARKLDKPMRVLAKKFPNRFGWWVRWFDATLGSDESKS